MLRAARPGLYRPEKINPALPAGTGYGDVDGGKGIGEIGITGTAAAIGNAVYHATGRC